MLCYETGSNRLKAEALSRKGPMHKQSAAKSHHWRSATVPTRLPQIEGMVLLNQCRNILVLAILLKGLLFGFA